MTSFEKAVASIANLIEDNEKITLPFFIAKLQKAATAHPEDYTIGMIYNVTSRMDDNRLFISRAEIKNLYNKLYSRNTKFASIFKDELGTIEKLAGAKKYVREEDNGFDALSKIYATPTDQTLVNSLNVAFGNKSNGYSEIVASEAKKICIAACNTPAVEIVNGNESCIVCSASFETPKGKVSFFVPIEIVANRALIPSVFIGNDGSKELGWDNIKQYVIANAGNKLIVTAALVLDTINQIKNPSEISSVDLALTRMKAEAEDSTFIDGQILHQTIEQENKNPDVKVVKIVDPEMESFADKFGSAHGIASFNFGLKKVDLGRSLITNKLNSFGLKNYQISVCNADDTATTYAVSINAGQTAFKVPVKMSKNNVSDPSIMISNGSIESFSKEGLSSLSQRNIKDYKTAATASPMYGLKASELVGIVKEAMQELNYAKAEDALNVLHQGTDDKAYKSALSIFTNGLSGITKQASKKCSMIVKNSSSQHELCGHLGLPLHKVSQDKFGQCIAKYREGMNETYEGAYFINSKIFV